MTTLKIRNLRIVQDGHRSPLPIVSPSSNRNERPKVDKKKQFHYVMYNILGNILLIYFILHSEGRLGPKRKVSVVTMIKEYLEGSIKEKCIF